MFERSSSGRHLPGTGTFADQTYGTFAWRALVSYDAMRSHQFYARRTHMMSFEPKGRHRRSRWSLLHVLLMPTTHWRSGVMRD